MDIYCTRPSCPDPVNSFSALDNSVTFKAVQQRYCAACTMPLILDNRYLPLKRLGRGAFGLTFLALDLRSAKRRQCIVKQLQPTGELTPSQLEAVKRAFRREAETLETLGDEHHQIPSLYAYFELTTPEFMGMKFHQTASSYSEEYFYLVQERIDGQDLTKEINQKGPLSEAEVLEVLRQILPVLQFIHEHDVIHRDIKPSNIMRDQNNRIFLIDFGAVKQVTTGMPMQNSIVFGTLGFAPPEQVAGRQVFPASDLYSLAVTLLCLLTARDPQELFQPYGNPLSWRSALSATSKELHVQVSDRLGEVLDRMLQPMPKQRYQTAIEVMGVLFPELLPCHGQSMVQAKNPAALLNAGDTTLPFQDDNATIVAQSTNGAAHPLPSPVANQAVNQATNQKANQATNQKAEALADPNATIVKPPATSFQKPKPEIIPPKAPPPVLPTTVQPQGNPLPPEAPLTRIAAPQSGLTADFLVRCREALAYYIGPIAGFVVEEALEQGSYSSQHQFVETLAQEIPDPQEAQEFKRRLF